MKAVLLCAGFATRLYPLTQEQPKSLLPIAGQPLLNYLLKLLEGLPSLTRIFLVSNHKFYSLFSRWADRARGTQRITVLDDGIADHRHRLGPVRDLKIALDQEGAHEDVLVLAGDNLIDSELAGFLSFAKSKRPAPSVGVWDVQDREAAKKYGLVETDASGKITAFFEKPMDPPTTLASMGLYFFPSQTLVFVNRYLETSANSDALGHYVSWLARQMQVFTFPFQGAWFDIGDLESYRLADQYVQKKAKR